MCITIRHAILYFVRLLYVIKEQEVLTIKITNVKFKFNPWNSTEFRLRVHCARSLLQLNEILYKRHAVHAQRRDRPDARSDPVNYHVLQRRGPETAVLQRSRQGGIEVATGVIEGWNRISSISGTHNVTPYA